jgi:hypothetical protein
MKCQELRFKLTKLKIFKQEFDLELSRVRDSKNLPKISDLKIIISVKMDEIYYDILGLFKSKEYEFFKKPNDFVIEDIFPKKEIFKLLKKAILDNGGDLRQYKLYNEGRDDNGNYYLVTLKLEERNDNAKYSQVAFIAKTSLSQISSAIVGLEYVESRFFGKKVEQSQPIYVFREGKWR